MRLLWLCNRIPGAVKACLDGKVGSGGLWVDSVLRDLRAQDDLTIHILAPGKGETCRLDDRCSFSSFPAKRPFDYLPEQETQFCRELKEFRPDVIHIWGTEFAHTLAMVNAAEKCDLLDRTVVSIQGLCSVYAGHYAEGVPESVQRRYSFRDLLRRDNIRLQQKKFALRGDLEVQALQKVRHVIGRTAWDKACTARINPQAQYHFCNETLRETFYQDTWQYDSCEKHRIFASSCAYPVKGFHYLLEAFAQVRKAYPDAVLTVTGRSVLGNGLRQRLLRCGYDAYLARLVEKYHLEGHVRFLGSLNSEQMKEAFLRANVFALPSTIENSPNSLGEAMLLGMPCVASDVGGVTDLMTHGKEGFVYQSTAPYMLAHYIQQAFAMGEEAAKLGAAARQHASHTHDPEKNLSDLLSIYRALA